MARSNHTPRLAHTEEALTVLFCLIDDAYRLLNPHARRYEFLKRLSDSELIALALFQQLRGMESERSFLRDTERFFSHLFPGVVGLHPSSFHRRMRKLRRFLEPLRREILCRDDRRPGDVARRLYADSGIASRAGSPELGVPRRCVGKVGVLQRLRREASHALCATNGVPISYELTPANVADVSLAEEFIAGTKLGYGMARKLLGEMAYRSGELREILAEM